MDLIAAIKQEISILDYARMSGYTIQKAGNEYTLAEHNSIRINAEKNTFFRHSTGKGGDVIDFVTELRGMSTQEAIAEMRGMLSPRGMSAAQSGLRPRRQVLETELTEPRRLELPDPIGTKYKRLFAYLIQTRCIDPLIVQQLVKDKLLYEDERGNICFCGRDYDGEMKYAGLRTTSDSGFRGDVRGSDGSVSFTIHVVPPQAPPPEYEPLRTLFVSESAIDCMSLMNLLQLYELPLGDSGFLALSGCSPKALMYHLAHHPQIEKIYLCQDNDDAGNQSRIRCREELDKAGYGGRVIDKPPAGKDFNDDLIQLKNNLQLERGLTHELEHKLG